MAIFAVKCGRETLKEFDSSKSKFRGDPILAERAAFQYAYDMASAPDTKKLSKQQIMKLDFIVEKVCD